MLTVRVQFVDPATGDEEYREFRARSTRDAWAQACWYAGGRGLEIYVSEVIR